MSRLEWGGAGAVALAFFIWGLFPLYWVPLSDVPPFQLMAHRILWSTVALLLYLLVTRDLQWVRQVSGRTFSWLCLGAALISVNWMVYVVAVTTQHVVDASLGYFITPLANVALAVLVLREKLRGIQALAVALAAGAVTYLALKMGTPPWMALVLAVSFGSYGLVRKLVPIPGVHSLSVECAVLLLPALGYLLWCEQQGTGRFGHGRWQEDLLLIIGGPVTAIPLVLFAHGAQRVSMIALGLLQYISPTVGLMIGVWVLREPFGPERQIAFGIIWVALALVTVDSIRRFWFAKPVKV